MIRLLSLSLLIASALSIEAATIVVTPSKDNTLYEDGGGSYSNGAGEVLFAGVTGPFGGVAKRRAVLSFDIAGSLPEGAVIESVSLRIHAMNAASSLPMKLFLHALLKNWGEGLSDAGPTGGTGVPSQPGDATWIHTSFGDSLWDTPGGDFDPEISAQLTASAAGHYDFTGPGLLADVESWLANPETNFGWLIRGEEAGETFTARRIGSKESQILEYRPTLTISYSVIPEPSTGLLLVPALGILLAAARRKYRSARNL